MKILFSKEMS